MKKSDAPMPRCLLEFTTSEWHDKCRMKCAGCGHFEKTKNARLRQIECEGLSTDPNGRKYLKLKGAVKNA